MFSHELFFFFKQKTAYEMRISDWSSDVCSSDLLDAALLGGHIDAAVHSMKDVETIRPPEIRIAAMLPRADVRDRLIGAASVEALPMGARVGTASPRRAAQLLALRPDLKIGRSEEHTSELQSLMRISYAVF